MYLQTVLIFSTFSYISTQTIVPEEEEIEKVIPPVDAVLSRSATLPCNIEPDIREDRVYMVLWYRDGYSKPIYSFDVRGRSFNKALHWSDPNIFGPRAYFVTVSKPAALTLDGVQLDDQGIYRCRVDFRTTPTRNFAINLTVIVPPHQLLLYDNSGRDVSEVIGPLVEGSDLILTCEVRGGRPTPTVSWFVNDKMVDGQFESIGSNVIVNRLKVDGVSRELLNSTYKCQASNTKLTMPSEKSVQLDLLLRPSSVFITTKPNQLLANEDMSIPCMVNGSRPTAVVSWKKDNAEFKRGKVFEKINETYVISTLTFMPLPEDDGSIFKCIGENPKLTGVSLEDSFKLTVVYPPQVVLHLGNTLNPDDIREGSDVYFECHVKSNPKQQKISWYRDNMPVNQNMTSGIIISTQSLVLQRVTKWQSGSYTCLASNLKGETMSNPVLLRVRYAPVCSKENEIIVIGGSVDEALKVRCEVSADPTDITFLWQFNNSGESFDVSPDRFATSIGNLSELIYTPISQRDYGTLTCWGTNSIGRQMEPCIFQVVPAAKPNSLSNCTLRTTTNQTQIVEIECKAGYDGGLPQHFILEAYDTHSKRMRMNLTVTDVDSPLFRLDLGELSPSPLSLHIEIYAQNAKGCSEKLVLEDILINDAERRTDGSNSTSLLPLAGLLTGSLLTLGMAVLVIVVIAVRQKQDFDDRLHCAHHINIDASKQNTISRQGSMLEINTGDSRYVVAYTLKPAADCGISFPPLHTLISSDLNRRRQPDILNTPRGELGDGHFQNCKTLTCFSSLEESNCDISNALGKSRECQMDISYPHFVVTRGDSIITDTIPGPESCV